MRPGRPSRTAQHNALFRALEQRLPEPLFADPWARRFLRGRYRLAALLPAPALARAIDARWPGPRAAVVRAHALHRRRDRRGAARAGSTSSCILGAGFDARAHRLPGIERVRVFEVDHPSTQAMKRRGRRAAPRPRGLRPRRLRAATRWPRARATRGCATEARTLFLWEGVTNYLDEPRSTRRCASSRALGQALIFTYVDRAVLDGADAFAGGPESVAYVRALGEPFTFGFDPAELRAYLRRARPRRSTRTCRSRTRRAATTPGARPPVSAFYHVVSARCRG